MNANGELVHLIGLVAKLEKCDELLFDVLEIYKAALKIGQKDLAKNSVEKCISLVMKLKREIKDFLSDCGPLNVDNTLGLKLNGGDGATTDIQLIECLGNFLQKFENCRKN